MKMAMNAFQNHASTPKINPRIEARLNEYIEAHQRDFAHHSRLVSGNPAHAATAAAKPH